MRRRMIDCNDLTRHENFTWNKSAAKATFQHELYPCIMIRQNGIAESFDQAVSIARCKCV